MEFNKWLKRKYPVSHIQLLKQFENLEYYIKDLGYSPAIMKYSDNKGELCLGKCSKEYSWEEWNGLYDQSYSSDTWTGYWDCRYYLTNHDQKQCPSKLWEYLTV